MKLIVHDRVYYPQKKQTDFIWGHEDIVLCVDTFANYIVSGSKDNTIKLWHYMDGNFRLMATFKGTPPEINIKS